MKIVVRVKPKSGPWRSIADAVLDRVRTLTLSPSSVGEEDEVRLIIQPGTAAAPAIRVYVGAVLVASSIVADRVLFIKDDGGSDADPPPLVCNGDIFADWMGITELVVEFRHNDIEPWHKALVLPMAIAPGKLKVEEFDRLFVELERDSAAVLMDIYSKTQLGLKSDAALASSASVAILRRVRSTVRELCGLLRRIGKQPSCRLRNNTTRDLATPGQAVSDATLAEACTDNRMLLRTNGRLALREHLREHSRPDYTITEHQAIANFGEYLRAQLGDLRLRIDAEISERQERKRWRSSPKSGGGATWWEQEDLPRIEELAKCRDDVGQLRQQVDAWSAISFLPSGICPLARPQSTPLFRNHPLYRRAYEIIAEHFRAFRTTLDNQLLLTRVRSLPKLYEWWYAVRILRLLASGLAPLSHDPLKHPVVIIRLTQERKTFTIEFSTDQAMTFEDRNGGRVRFRYEPRYTSIPSSRGASIGLLGGERLKTPDIAIEIYPAGKTPADVPELIIILDAKYSSSSHRRKLGEVEDKYSKIGDLATGRVLSRQVWALTPQPPTFSSTAGGLQSHCTVDNQAFWSEHFEMVNPVNGAIETRPVPSAEFDSLEALLCLLLKRSGIYLS
jgi:hypothetical protein